MARKKLLIKVSSTNCPPWISYITGIGRSTLCLLNAMQKLDDIPFDIVVYADGFASLLFNFHNWKWKHHRIPIPTQLFGKFYMPFQLLWRHYFTKYDLLHIPHNWDAVYNGEEFVVTIHDTIEYEIALEEHNKQCQERYHRIVCNSKGIITCSQYSKQRIIEIFDVPEDKVHVVYWGISKEIFHISDGKETISNLKSIGVEYPYFVSVSCWHPRKNMRTLLKAYRRFIANGGRHKLVLVWGNPPKDLLEEYDAEIADKKLIFLDYVSDDVLRSLYNGASCTMFPSRAEGFGFPILESFACGTPVMTCRNTCLEEVGQDAAIYVGEDDTDGMVNVMNMFDVGSYDVATFQTRAERIVKDFTWENTARQYVDFYKKYL